MSNNKKPKLDQKMLLDSILRKKEDKGAIIAQQETEPSIEDQETVIQPAKSEPYKRKRTTQSGYNDTFLKRNEIKSRQCVYVSKGVHETISKIVKVIADNDITVGGYIDLVLLKHLEDNKTEINELYRQERMDLI